MKLWYLCEVKNGKLIIKHRERLVEQIRQFDGEVILTIDKAKKPRTRSQNSYYWGAVLETIADHTGHTPNELHSYFKAQFLPRKDIVVKKRLVSAEGSTSDLSTKEFTDYIERIAADVAEMGITLPTPDYAGYTEET